MALLTDLHSESGFIVFKL